MGEWIGRYHGNGHGGRAYDKSAVYRYEQKARKLTKDVQESYKSIARAIMHEHTGGRVGLRIVMGPRRWKFEPVVVCGRCEKEFVPERISESMCKRCRRAK